MNCLMAAARVGGSVPIATIARAALPRVQERWRSGGESISMIAPYPERSFQLWECRVSHGSLLNRSPKGQEG